MPADLPGWEQTLVEIVRLVCRRSSPSPGEVDGILAALRGMAWRNSTTVSYWVAREGGRLRREAAWQRLRAGATVSEVQRDLQDALDLADVSCGYGRGQAGHEQQERIITLLMVGDWGEANHSGAHGQHRYTAEQYGLSKDEIRADYDFYIRHFDVPLEG